jgi:Patatin-like phospholipase
MTQLRIAVTLPGEASLGAFQAGAMSALVVALQALNAEKPDAVRLDAMTATSSGSLTSVLAAHALLTGQDPVDPLRRAWVTESTVDALRGRDRRAPLTLDRAREVATELLVSPEPSAAAKGAQAVPIDVNFALTSLRGVTYRIRRPGRRRGKGTPATTYLDWAEHKLCASGTVWQDVVDSAIASASHPAAFPPTLLDRSHLATNYVRNGVEGFPECPVLWYADGGLLDREPLGRCLKLIRDGDGHDACDRVVLLLRPEPDVELKADDPAWTEADDEPSWTTTMGRALRIVVTHSLYEDLRRVERVNSRIEWRQLVSAELARVIPDDADTRDTLETLIKKIRRQKDTASTGGPRTREPLAKDVRGLLDQALDEATGLAGKRSIDVHVISAADAADVAGGSLLNFGGFLGERLRANDFLVGYQAMVQWMRGYRRQLAGAPLKAAEQRAATIPGWIGGIAGRRSLSWRDRAQVLRIAGRAARIGLRGSESRRV